VRVDDGAGIGLGAGNSFQRHPRLLSPAPHHDLSFNAAALLFAEVVSHPAAHAQTEAWARVALDGARQKRGPPAVRLS
jgi:hypothetical protein